MTLGPHGQLETSHDGPEIKSDAGVCESVQIALLSLVLDFDYLGHLALRMFLGTASWQSTILG